MLHAAALAMAEATSVERIARCRTLPPGSGVPVESNPRTRASAYEGTAQSPRAAPWEGGAGLRRRTAKRSGGPSRVQPARCGPPRMSETRTRVLHWFVSGGVAKTPDGRTFKIDVDPLVVGRDVAAAIVLADPEVSALHCE